MARIRDAARSTDPPTQDRPTAAKERYIQHYRALCTSPSSATVQAFWLGFAPSLEVRQRKWARYHWVEIYLVLFPFSTYVLQELRDIGGRTPQCDPDCVVCKEFCDHATAYGLSPDTTTHPKWKPSVSTGKAPGMDGVSAEMFRFIRSDNGEKTLDYRIRLAKVLATVFDLMVGEGPPAGIVDVVITAIAKVSKSGVYPDPMLPNETRGISVHNVLAKLHDTLIDVRFIHAAVTRGLVPRDQSGFMPHRSTTQAAFMLHEVVKARTRHGQDTWVVFIDFWKAYDTVSPEVMWATLHRIGFPPDIIAYLRYCFESRTTHFSYNGEKVATWTQMLGLCQGGVLSCLLFNLFIASLSKWLDSRGGLSGVTVTTPGGTFVLLHQLFADDMAAFAVSRGQLVRLLEALAVWCDAHKMRINVSAVIKTAATFFSAADAHAPLPAPMEVNMPDGTVLEVPFTNKQTNKQFRLLAMARLGRIGLFTAPFMPQLPQPPRVPRNHPLHAAFQAHQSDRYRVIYRFTACNLCGVAGGDLVHMCTVCQHPLMVVRREAALGGG